MSQQIREQIVGFLIMFFCGAGIAMFRQLFIKYKSRAKLKAIVTIQELLFWLLSALITSAFLYYASYGAVNIHMAIAFTLGIIMWYNISKVRN